MQSDEKDAPPSSQPPGQDAPVVFKLSEHSFKAKKDAAKKRRDFMRERQREDPKKI